MPGRILIVEDNDGVARLIEEVVQGLGATAERTGSGTEAIASIERALPTAVVLDLVLGDVDGFQVANIVRDQPGGADVPIVIVSGVFKKLPDAFAERVQPQFLAKPFDMPRLRELLASAIGMTVTPPTGSQLGAPREAGRGRFDRSSPAETLLRLLEKRATGQLEVVSGDVRRRLFLQSGQVRAGQSNVKAENAGGAQLAAGQLAQAAFDAAIAHAKAQRVPLHDALVATRAMTAEQAQQALRQQTSDVGVGLLGMAGAEWSFSEADVERQPDARKHPVELLAAFARRTLSPSDARRALAAQAEGRVQRAPLLERELFIVRSAWPGETLTTLITGKGNLQQVIEKARDEDLPYLWALVTSGLLLVESRSAGTAASSAGVLVHGSPTRAAAPAGDDPDRGRRFKPAEQEARAFIFRERERFEQLSHYELLGVAKGVSPEDARKAYLNLARKYHSDAYAGLELGSAQSVLSELFQRLGEAASTLGDEQRRAEYDIYLDRKAKGLPTDVAAILKAESIFQRGEILLKANKHQDAADLFRQAIALNHAEPEFHACLAWTQWRLRGKEALEEARAALQKAVADSPHLAVGYAYLGAIARETGNDREAKAHLSKALEIDANHELALRELRTLNRTKEKAEGSLLKKLFGR